MLLCVNTTSMNTFSFQAWIRLLIIASCNLLCTYAATDWLDENCQLIAKDTMHQYALDQDEYEKLMQRPFTNEEKLVLDDSSGEKWTTYTDAGISFDYPNSPLVKVDTFVYPKQTELNIPHCAYDYDDLLTDYSYQKIYRITLSNEIPIGLIIVTNKPWFDDVMCNCGNEKFRTLIHANGVLNEITQLEGGEINKYQLLNDTHRVIFYEWMHFPITQKMYRHIGSSIRLKIPSKRTEKEWRDYSMQKRGFEAGLGWLRKGMSSNDVIAILGEPNKKNEKNIFYQKFNKKPDGNVMQNDYTLSFKDDKLGILAYHWKKDENWHTESKAEPTVGTHAWLENKKEEWTDEKSPKKKAKPFSLTDLDIAALLQDFKKNAPNAKGADWEYWCEVLHFLQINEVSDDEALKIVQKKCFDKTLPQLNARLVLDSDHPDHEKLVYERLKLILNFKKEGDLYANECEDLYMCIPGYEKSENRSLIQKGLEHPNFKIRRAAINGLDALDENEAAKLLKKPLSDIEFTVRKNAISAISSCCTKKDQSWLKQLIPSEKNFELRAALKENIEKLKD